MPSCCHLWPFSLAAERSARRVVIDVVALAIARLLVWVMRGSSLLRGGGVVPAIFQLLRMAAPLRAHMHAGLRWGDSAHMSMFVCALLCSTSWAWRRPCAHTCMRVCAGAVTHTCACWCALCCAGGAKIALAHALHGNARARPSSDTAQSNPCALLAQGTVNAQ